MKLALLFAYLLAPAAFALTPAAGNSLSMPDTNACAKVALASVYAGQKSYEAEYKRFGATFADIGYAPEGGPCQKMWDLSMRLFNGATEFRAEAVHRGNGETWEINQRKEMKQTQAPR